MKIREMAAENRPRERLLAFGAGSLSDAELLSIILRTGSNGENVIDMCQRILSLDIEDLSIVELQKIKGLGKVKSVQIKAMFELISRLKRKRVGKVITCARDVYEYMVPKMRGLKQEHFVVLLLDSKNRIIKEETVFIGTLNAALVHPREIFRLAIKESANSIIVVHNHPSGDCEPSDEDRQVTEQLKKMGSLFDIRLLDHVVVGDERFQQI